MEIQSPGKVWSRVVNLVLHPPGNTPMTASFNECRGWNLETNMLSHWKEQGDLIRQVVL